MIREKQEIGTTSGEGFPLSHDSLARPRRLVVAGSRKPVQTVRICSIKHKCLSNAPQSLRMMKGEVIGDSRVLDGRCTFTSTLDRNSPELATFDSSPSHEFHLRLIPFHPAGIPRMLAGRRSAREVERVRARIAIDRAAASTFTRRARIRSLNQELLSCAI